MLREKRWYGELEVVVPVSVTASERCGREALLAHGGTARPHDRGLVNAAAAARAHVVTRMGRARGLPRLLDSERGLRVVHVKGAACPAASASPGNVPAVGGERRRSGRTRDNGGRRRTRLHRWKKVQRSPRRVHARFGRGGVDCRRKRRPRRRGRKHRVQVPRCSRGRHRGSPDRRGDSAQSRLREGEIN